MSDNSSKIHLRIGDIEISIEGTPEFVGKQYQQMEKELNLGRKITESVKETTPAAQKEEPSETKEAPKSEKSSGAPKTQKSQAKTLTKEGFDEWLKRLPKGLKNRDKALIAGFYNQLNSRNNVFRVRDMNNTLKENGIKITNPSSLIKNVAKSETIIKQVSRVGRQVYYQFTKEGEKYMNDLLSAKK
ncbi:MAG: hypothetical protein V5A47_06730 [Bacteroidales bacterium]|jgi:hypothetical protein|nr:hypothetical protein [Bacteroidales bacterium]MBS3776393.1 hypothetical protein [Bacteroidales bacterium]